MGLVWSGVTIVLEGVSLCPIDRVGMGKRYSIQESKYPVVIVDFRKVNNVIESIIDYEAFVKIFCGEPADIDIRYKSCALAQITLKTASEEYSKGDKLYLGCVEETNLPSGVSILCQNKLVDGRCFYIGIK